MSFTDEDFIEILNYCKDLTNFHENAKDSYDNIVNVSDSLIEDSRFWLFNFDNICENIYTKSNVKISKWYIRYKLLFLIFKSLLDHLK